MPELIPPLVQRRQAEMKELREKAEEGNKAAAARRLREKCREGMLVPRWER